ncbi:hydroxymethylglutaryl-CoA lyase [Amycolatopsis sp. cmx-4-68]|uniref:hydroxymethylglutaryl-CoA lyase n=1 Tax=Amycolatopsis sp. cmx-4-68 TaxID=2790938 RepID=UPI003978E360
MTITDVVLRDGLQDEPVFVPVERRAHIAETLVRAGVRNIEAVSFVSPTRVPQMAGAEELVGLLRTMPNAAAVRFSGLALNGRGAARAIDAGLQEVHVAMSASRAHSKANAGSDVEELLGNLRTVVSAHPEVTFTAGISTSFICPFEGDIPADRVVELAAAFLELGIRQIGLADTLGTATTDHVMTTVDTVLSAVPEVELSLHLHDAAGQALATVDAAIERGITRFDAATGGYGGCPFAPGAHGNIATEDLIGHLHARGIHTGIDEHLLDEAVRTIHREIASAAPLVPEHGET